MTPGTFYSSGFFSGKVVVVTGSSRGIGKATALAFLQAGARVVLNGRNAEALASALADFRLQGYEAYSVACDVSCYEGCETLIRESLACYGRVDILVNNAGIGFRGEIAQSLPEVVKTVIDSNLMSAIYCSQAALPEIKKNKGSILYISSVNGIRGFPGLGPYCISKMGLTALAESLRVELHGTGVHIGLLMLGLTEYDAHKRVMQADGSMEPISRRYHQSLEQVAELILRCARRRQRRVVLSMPGKILAFAQWLSPSWVEWILIRSRSLGFYK